MCVRIALFSTIVTTILLCPVAHAGDTSDALGQCLVKYASASDKKLITQLGFVTLGQTRAAREIVKISPKKTERINRDARKVVFRLLSTDCPGLALQTVLSEGKTGIMQAVQFVAMQGLHDDLGDELEYDKITQKLNQQR